MKRSTVLRDFVIGLTFLGSLIVLGIFTLQVANLNLFGMTRSVRVPFSKVNGLRVGDDVRIYGLKVGVVSAIEPNFSHPERRLRVRCSIYEDVRLPENSRFYVRSAGPLGGRYVDIVRGESTTEIPIEEGAFTGESEGDLFQELGSLIEEIKTGNGLLGELIRNETIGDDFGTTMAEVRRISQAISNKEGALGALVMDGDVRDRVLTAVNDIQQTLNDIKTGKGTVGMLINDEEVREDVRTLIANVEKITTDIEEGRGTIGKLLKESQLHDDLEETIASVKNFVKDLESGDGTLNMLATDEGFKNSLKESVDAFKGTMVSVNEGEGTLGQIIKNREVYDQLTRILSNMEDAVEDFREQAPISTFVNAVFAGF